MSSSTNVDFSSVLSASTSSALTSGPVYNLDNPEAELSIPAPSLAFSARSPLPPFTLLEYS